MRQGALFAGLGHAAASVAADHADRESPGWTAAATRWVESFSAAVGRQFVASECVAAAVETGLEIPPDSRAWGYAFRAAKKAGKIVAVGVGRSTNPRHHGAFSTIWEAAK